MPTSDGQEIDDGKLSAKISDPYCEQNRRCHNQSIEDECKWSCKGNSCSLQAKVKYVDHERMGKINEIGMMPQQG